jgi:hypothetical protein
MRQRLVCLAIAATMGSGCAAELRAMRAESLFEHACAHDLDERLAIAADEYAASYELVPTAPAANNIGVIHARRGDLSAAETWFARAVALAETDVVARTNLAVILYHRGRSGDSLEQFLAARRLRESVAQEILPAGRVNWDVDRYLAATEHAAHIGAGYVDRLLSTSAPDPLAESGLQLAQSLTSLPVRVPL